VLGKLANALTQREGDTVEWIEVSVRVVPEAAEAVSELLSRYAPQGVAIDLGEDHDRPSDAPVVVRAYLSEEVAASGAKRAIEEGIWHLSQIWDVIPEPTFRSIPDQDWTAGWKSRVPTLHLGHQVVIKPSWRTYAPAEGEIVLEMDPGLAFGTGLHPTTQLCVEAVEDFVQPGARVLDLGTGTGILALVAVRLGAGSVLAVDTDENAITAARQNFRANDALNAIELRHGSLANIEDRYDLILANILAPVIESMAEEGLAARLQSGGVLVASGILDDQVDAVTEVLMSNGLHVTECRTSQEWAALIAQRA
jgi:ribosomal protein L11 methyltransferase